MALSVGARVRVRRLERPTAGLLRLPARALVRPLPAVATSGFGVRGLRLESRGDARGRRARRALRRSTTVRLRAVGARRRRGAFVRLDAEPRRALRADARGDARRARRALLRAEPGVVGDAAAAAALALRRHGACCVRVCLFFFAAAAARLFCGFAPLRGSPMLPRWGKSGALTNISGEQGLKHRQRRHRERKKATRQKRNNVAKAPARSAGAGRTA